MRTARLAHTATRLADGRVLVVGGEDARRDMIASAEIFDPTTETWSEAEPLTASRSNHVAELLADGRVLIAGGGRSAPIGQPSSKEVTSAAMLFDPASGRFTPTGSLVTPRSHFGAVHLRNGEVLVAGGGAATTSQNCTGAPDCGSLADPLASAEIYDPVSGTFRAAASMKVARYSFTLTLLADGRAMAAGGVTFKGTTLTSTRSVEIYDPNTDAWSDAAEMPSPDREHHSAILTGTGDVLLVGGKQANIGMIKRADLYSPSTNGWRPASPLTDPRTVPHLVRLESGRILAVGGYDQPDQEFVAETVLFDEASSAWTKLPDLADGRLGQSTTLLLDGSVLVAGGMVSPGRETASCEMTKSE